MKSKGFTLLEVMVAAAVFALMATVIAGAYVNILRAYQAVADNGVREAQLRFARSQFLTLADRVKAEEGADFDDGDTRINWKAEIAPTRVPDLYRCEWICTLRKAGEPKEDRVTEIFWLLRTEWARPDERGPVQQKFREALEKGMPEGWRQEGRL